MSSKKHTPTLEECPTLCAAAESFVRDNVVFEASVPVDRAVAELKTATTWEAAFNAPLSHKVMSFEVALRWALFWSVAPAHAAELAPAEAAFGKGKFDATAALGTVAQVYDLGVDGEIFCHFDADEDDEDASDDEEDA